MPHGDQDLIDETLDGSCSAYEQLMRRHEQAVYRIAYSCVKEEDAAFDVSQNVFLKAYRNLRSFGGRSTFRTWLTRIAMNEGVSYLRVQRRHAGHEELTQANTPACPAPQEGELLRRERRDALLAEIRRLNPRQGQALQLRYFEEMPIREIAGVLECSEGQAKNILFRGLQALRRRLAGPGERNQELRR